MDDFHEGLGRPGPGGHEGGEEQIPERENLKFDIPTIFEAPTQVLQLVQHIQNVAEMFLYHWKTFPIGMYIHIYVLLLHVDMCRLNICVNFLLDLFAHVNLHRSLLTVLPPPILQAASTSASPDLNRKSRAINLRDLFVAPPFDELDAVATDNHGEPRRLTFKQLRTLRERG